MEEESLHEMEQEVQQQKSSKKDFLVFAEWTGIHTLDGKIMLP
jgi:hypothetical protein